MDLYLSRQEIRRQACVLAGYTSDLSLSAQDKARFDGYIDAGSLKVAGANRWVGVQRRATVGLPQDTSVISYRQIEEAYWMEGKYPNQYHPGTFGTTADSWRPSDLASAPICNVGPGGILEVSCWNPQKYEYYPLYKATQQTRFDMDRWQDLTAEVQMISVAQGDSPAETTAAVTQVDGLRKQNRSRPFSYQPEQTGIRIWPIPDVPAGWLQYVLRVIYTVTPTWQYQYQGLTAQQIDQTPSVVDAQAIIYYVVAQMFAQQGDDLQMTNYLGQMDQRIRELRAFQSTGESISQDTEAAYDRDYETNLGRQLPNWQTWPTVFNRQS